MSKENAPPVEGAGARLIAAIQDAAAGNFARVTVNGQVWERRDASTPPGDMKPVDHKRTALDLAMKHCHAAYNVADFIDAIEAALSSAASAERERIRKMMEEKIAALDMHDVVALHIYDALRDILQSMEPSHG